MPLVNQKRKFDYGIQNNYLNEGPLIVASDLNQRLPEDAKSL